MNDIILVNIILQANKCCGYLQIALEKWNFYFPFGPTVEYSLHLTKILILDIWRKHQKNFLIVGRR